MRKLGKVLVEQIVAQLRDTDAPVERWSDGAVRILGDEDVGNPPVTVTLSGAVTVWGFGEIPFDWGQRRSIGRAARWRHARETAELITLGERAKREQAKEK